MPRRLTEAEVRQRIAAKHGDRITMLHYGGTLASSRSAFLCNVCGYEWTAPAGDVSRVTGCADCAGVRRLTEAEVRERIAAKHGDRITMLHYGGTLKSSRSGFLCNVCGYEWTTGAGGVTSGHGCINCAGRRPLTEAEVRERIAAKHGDRITMLRFGSKSMARSDFRCTVCNYEWSTTPKDVYQGQGCADCAGVRRLTEAEVRERLAAKHGDRITMLHYGGTLASSRSAFLCNVCGYEWTAPAAAVSRVTGCADCAGVRRLTEAEVRERIAAKHGDRITVLHYGGTLRSSRSAFLCNVCGRQWTTAAENVTKGGCLECSGSRPHTEAEVHDLIGNTHGDKLTMTRYGNGMNRRSDFLCNVCGHSWTTAANNVVSNRSGCAACSGKRQLTEADVRERIAAKHGDRIAMVSYAGTLDSSRSAFLCNVCGHRWTAPAAAVSRFTGCAACSGVRPLTEAEVHERVRQSHGDRITMLRYGGGVDAPSDFLCNVCRYEWTTGAGDVTSGHGCINCAGRRPLTESEVRDRIRQSQGGRITMLRYGNGTNRRSDFLCNVCGYEWTAETRFVMNGRAHCPACSEYGFNLRTPARAYLIYNLDLHAAKVGVTTAVVDRRLNTFRHNGWRVYKIKAYATGAEALAEEQRILADWRAQGYPEAVTKADMPMGGWTETAPLSALPGWELLVEGVS